MANEGGDLYLSCRSDNDCVLTPTPVGEEKVTEQSFANTFQTEQVTFEFEAEFRGKRTSHCFLNC